MAYSGPVMSAELQAAPGKHPFAFPDGRGRPLELSDVPGIVDSSSERRVLVGNRGCPFAHRAWLTLHELGAWDEVEYLHVDLGEYKPQWFVEALNQDGTVPVLWDQGTCVPESLVVMEYLADKFGPDAHLFGRNPAEKAMVQLALSKLPVAAIYGLLRCRDPAKLDAAKEACDKAMDRLEALYADEGPFLLGGHLSAVDVAFTPFLARFVPALRYWRQYELLREDGHPKLKELWATMQDRPAFKATTCDPDFFVDAYWSYAHGPRAGPLPEAAVTQFVKNRPATALSAAALTGAAIAALAVLGGRQRR